MYKILKYSFIIVILSALVSLNTFAKKNCTGECSSCSSQTECNSASKASTSSNSQDEFLPYDSTESSQQSTPSSTTAIAQKQDDDPTRVALWWLVGTMAFTVLAGIFVKFNHLRHFKYVFLISSVAILGFFRESCPCPISGFQQFILMPLKGSVYIIGLVWFVGLVPITYFFGKVWCGWVCHLGAFQEFLYKKNKFKALKSVTAQKIMKRTRLSLFVVLIIQLIATKSIYFCKIDPFRTAYTFWTYSIADIATFSLNDWFAWTLLVLIILLSIFMYRPFCKAACPVGLVLGWVSKIPGAARIEKNEGHCLNCSAAVKSCKIQAISKSDNCPTIDQAECMACGDCMSSCSTNNLHMKNSFLKK